MIVKRLFQVARSYVNDYVERKEDEYGFDNEEEKREFREWKKRQYEKYEKKYDDYSSRGSRNSRSSSSKKEKKVNAEEQYFKNLELKPTKDFMVIKKQYRKLMKKYHPDRYPNDPEKQKTAQKITSKLNESYAYFKKKHEKK